jgi:hypothetical protein
MAAVEQPSPLDSKVEAEMSREDVSTERHSEIPATGQEPSMGIPPVHTSHARNQSEQPHFQSNFYQKLPHPFSYLLKEVPVIDGSDVDKLLDFLLKVVCLRQHASIKEPTIYELIYPHCRGECLGVLTQAIAVKESFELFHGRF